MNFTRTRVVASSMALAFISGTAVAQSTTTPPAAATDFIDATQTLPPNARPGQCWTKAMIPALFNEESIDVLRAEGSEKIEVEPAQYETTEEKVLVKDASFKLVPVPAVYDTAEEKIEVKSARSVWMNGTGGNAKEASITVANAAAAAGVRMDQTPPGQCMAEHFQAAQYKTENVRVMVKEASKKVEIIPATFQTVEEKVLVKEASKKLVEVPAVYDTLTEKVLIQPASTVWKKGRGPTERIDNTTGEIMCLVEIPAQYETIEKKVVKTPATTKIVEIPAEYATQKVNKLVTPAQERVIEIPAEYTEIEKQVLVSESRSGWFADGSTSVFGKATGRQVCRLDVPADNKVVEKRVLKTPATVKKVEVPAEYKTVKVRRMVAPPKENRIAIPAIKETMVKRVKVSEERLEWRPVLCETNINVGIIRRIQNALNEAGYSPGPVDGELGQGTLRAAEKYQSANGLGRGGLTIETLKSLGIEI